MPGLGWCHRAFHSPPHTASADPDPAGAGFDVHLGYEADLLTALEAMEGLKLTLALPRGSLDHYSPTFRQYDAGRLCSCTTPSSCTVCT